MLQYNSYVHPIGESRKCTVKLIKVTQASQKTEDTQLFSFRNLAIGIFYPNSFGASRKIKHLEGMVQRNLRSGCQIICKPLKIWLFLQVLCLFVFFSSTKNISQWRKSILNYVAKLLQVTASSVICSISWHSCRWKKS